MSVKVSLKYKQFRELKEKFEKALDAMRTSGRLSSRYLEGFIYSLLNVLRSNDQNKFLHYLLTFLNAFESEEVREFARELLGCFPISEEGFQKIGYMIVVGLMSIKGGE